MEILARRLLLLRRERPEAGQDEGRRRPCGRGRREGILEAGTDPAVEEAHQRGRASRVTSDAQQIASGSLYTAHITAQSNASEHFWLYDTIDVTAQKVLIGGTDGDDVSKVTVTDQDGNAVQGRHHGR